MKRSNFKSRNPAKDLISASRRIAEGFAPMAVSAAEAAERLAAAAATLRAHTTPIDRFRMSGGEFIVGRCLIVFFLVSWLPNSTLFAGEDKTVRDPSGRIVERQTTTATGETVRNAAGAIRETREIRKNSDGSTTVVVRDANGRIVRREDRKPN